NAWQFWFESALVFTAQWFRLGGGVVHPLMRRYATGKKFLGFFTFVVFGYSFFGVGRSAFLAQVLESLKPSCMPRFVKLPH
ncbi:hypothetical protein, partial [Vibrio parahaemolyticus]|uniref:hypothetical protein n=1 Tax=Vibrio parahaemolyticus TaxID=670 RepID=UPI00116EE5F3